MRAQAVQVARHPMRVADKGLEGPRRKDRPPWQRPLGDVMADIRQAFGRGQGHEGGVEADALRHMVEVPALQVLLERRLADQHNLEGELPGGWQVGKLPHLLEGLQGQVLRLIDDERHIPARVELVPEALLHLGPQGPEIVRRHRHMETAGHHGEDLHEREARLPEHYRGELR
jgi:hypothetical protein